MAKKQRRKGKRERKAQKAELLKANNKLNQACNNSKGVKCNIQQEFGISKTAILKTPLKVLATKLIIKKTFGYLERRVSNAASHCLLSKRDKARIGYNSTTAYLVSLGAKFQPTPKRWITSEIRYMVGTVYLPCLQKSTKT